MRYRGFVVLALALVVGGSEAAADFDFSKRPLADGLAQIIAYADPCGYEIDQSALEKYFVDNGLSDPEALHFIQTSVALMGKSNASLCTLTKATASSLHLVK